MVEASIRKATSLLGSAFGQPYPGFAPLWFRHELVGAVSPYWIERLDPALFKVEPRGDRELPNVRLKGGDRRSESGLIPIETINRWLAEWAAQLQANGHLPGWRGEAVQIFGANETQPLFQIERSLLRPFGLMLRSVQVNVHLVERRRLRVWVARRAQSKAIDPGLLDALVGGGIVEDGSPLETLTRECQEEAGIARSLARRAVPVGVIDSLAQVDTAGDKLLHRERVMLYDLKVPPEFTPRLLDGEVAEARLFEADEALATIRAGQWTREGAWATGDLIRRHAVSN